MLVLAASTRVVVLAIVLGPIVPFLWWGVGRVWRGEAQPDPRTRFSEEWQIRSFRVFPLIAAAFTLAFVALIIDIVWGHRAGASDVAYRITSLGAIALCVLAFVVRFTSRPRWMVPPPYRMPRSASRRAGGRRL